VSGEIEGMRGKRIKMELGSQKKEKRKNKGPGLALPKK
jgi:hypothetical protein